MLHIVGKEFLSIHSVGRSLGGLGSEVLLVAWKNELEVVGVLETTLAGGVEELNDVAAAHVTDFVNSVVADLLGFQTYRMKFAKSSKER